MSEYKKSNPPSIKPGSSLPVITGLAMGAAVFLLLPVAQWIDAMTSKHSTRVDMYEMPPPPEASVMDEPEQQETEQEDIEEMEQDTPPPSLDMLELSLSSTISGLGTGDFKMPTFDITKDLSDMVYKISELDKRPRPTVRAAPQYPLDLRQAGVEGMVVVRFIVDERGTVSQVRVVKSTNPGFNESVIRTVRTWRFEPGEKDGRKVKSLMEQPIPFKLR